LSAAEPDVPALRFPGFAGPWRAAHGGDAFAPRRARGEPGLPLYAVTIDSGMVRRDSLEREILSNAADEANLRACQGDIVYNMMRMWQGAMGRAPEDCMVSPAYVVLAPKPQVSSRFFEHWFKRARSIHWLWAYSHGLTNDRLRLYFRDFAKVPMHFPDLAEQQKIADFLGAVDQRLQLHDAEVEALETYKRGLIQKLFSQEVRFTDKNGLAFPDWTATKLGELFDWLPTNSLSRDRLTDEGPGVQNIHYGDIHRRFSSRFLQSRESAPYVKDAALLGALRDPQYCRPGDVVIADASEDYADIGKAIEIIEVEPRSMVAGLHTILARPQQDALALGFAAYLFQSAPLRRQIRRVAQGISVLGLGKSHLAKLEISIPTPPEQTRIAELLGALDQKIDGVRAQADQLRTFKAGLLQKMFV
jgi:type I restriction enzyme S subunit